MERNLGFDHPENFASMDGLGITLQAQVRRYNVYLLSGVGDL